ncbi:MAG: pantothenate kinase [Flavobacteriia bacterium]|nr:MAG: pantothenate kinase [Flavobacteriia bacterium]
MKLILDVGNSRIKAGIFEGNTLQTHKIISYENPLIAVKKLIEKNNIEQSMVSSVGRLPKTVYKYLNDNTRCIILTSALQTPFNNRYETPHTLGVDRIALAAAAVDQLKGDNVLVMDAGTCITYDFINTKGDYLGGAIAPGLQTRYRALNDYTAGLPLLDKETPKDFTGNNTHQSIHSGVVNGMAREIDGVIEQYLTRYQKLTVVLTGGDADFLAKQLKSSIFVRPFFLLEGMLCILNLNSR